MAKSVNFSSPSVQLVSDELKPDSLIVLAEDVSKARPNALIKVCWTNLLDIVDRLSADEKTTLRSHLAISPNQDFRFKFTSATPITALAGDRIFIHESGDILIDSGLTAGDWFLIVDPYQKLRTQSNTVVAPTGTTIAAGQLKDGVDASGTFDLSSVGSNFCGGEIRFILDKAGNWAIDLSLCQGSGGGTPEPVTIKWVDVDPDFISTIDDAVFVELQIS